MQSFYIASTFLDIVMCYTISLLRIVNAYAASDKVVKVLDRIQLNERSTPKIKNKDYGKLSRR